MRILRIEDLDVEIAPNWTVTMTSMEIEATVDEDGNVDTIYVPDRIIPSNSLKLIPNSRYRRRPDVMADNLATAIEEHYEEEITEYVRSLEPIDDGIEPGRLLYSEMR